MALIAGTYSIIATTNTIGGVAVGTDKIGAVLRFRNTSDSVTVAASNGVWSNSPTDFVADGIYLTATGIFTISSTKNFELQIHQENNAAAVMQTDSSDAVAVTGLNRFADLTILKVA